MQSRRIYHFVDSRLGKSSVAATALLVAVGILASAAGPAQAYSRDTHQHIVELAWAYLKALDLCEPISVADPIAERQCLGACREDAIAFLDLEDGYTCSCLAESCEPLCSDLQGAEKFSCVARCATEGPGQSCVPISPVAHFCPAPLYWERQAGEEIVGEFCDRRCSGAADFVWEAECEAFSASSTDWIEAARRTVSYFQTFEATACPPTTYNYYGQDQCTAGLTTVPLELQRMEEVALSYSASADEPGYVPVLGGLLAATNSVTVDGEDKIDLSGTVIGYHSSVVDKIDDLQTEYRILPVFEDFLKTGAEILVGAGGGALAGLAAVGGILGCALSCPITIFFGGCDDCFDAVFDATKEILGETVEIIETIEESSLFGAGKGPTSAGHDNTSMFHYMSPDGFFDDIDGWQPIDAFGPGGLLVGETYEGLGLDLLFDLRVRYPPSRRPLQNFQIEDSDDAGRDSYERGVFYWHRLGFFDYTFPPVDNLSYYWWHKWLEGRLSGSEATYGLLPLGGTLHAIQDITQPFHAWGITLQGHAPYESRLSNALDPHAARCVDPSADCTAAPEVIIDLNDPAEEQAFIERVGQFVEQIEEDVLAPAGGVLHLRELMHYLRRQVVDADTTVRLSDDIGYLSWIDFDIEEDFVREVGIPLAVAATAVVLVEAARADLNPYQAALGLQLTDFEHKGPVPPTRSADNPGSDPPLGTVDIPEGYDEEHPEWVCASAQPRARDALERYFDNQLTGAEMMTLVLAEKLRCELDFLGMPIPDDATLDDVGRYETAMLKASTGFYAHGSVRRLERDLACNNAAPPEAIFSPAQSAVYASRCAGTLDSDGDGVADQLDGCLTPRALLDKGLTVQADGCVFDHEAVPESRVNPFIPGTVRIRKP